MLSRAALHAEGRPVCLNAGQTGDTDVLVDDEAAWLGRRRPTESDGDLFVVVRGCPTHA